MSPDWLVWITIASSNTPRHATEKIERKSQPRNARKNSGLHVLISSDETTAQRDKTRKNAKKRKGHLTRAASKVQIDANGHANECRTRTNSRGARTKKGTLSTAVQARPPARRNTCNIEERTEGARSGARSGNGALDTERRY